MVEVIEALKILSRRKIASNPGDGGQILQRSLSVVDITCLGNVRDRNFSLLTFKIR